MNPFSSGPPDAFDNMQIGDTSSPNFIPSFPMDMSTSVSSSNIMGWSSMENDLVANIMPGASLPMSQLSTSTYYSPTNNDNQIDPMLDNQQDHMMMLMMQQQQQQQQFQNQQFLLLQEQQQRQHQQQQQQLQLQQQQELQARRASRQQRIYQQELKQQQQLQQQQQLTNQLPHWFIKQQQAKLMKQNIDKSAPSPPVQIQSPPSLPSNKPMLEIDVIIPKRIELILTINQEIIRLCLEHQQPNLAQCEPDLTLYQMKLQSNLTYLATMADISMTKPEDQLKLPAPPDLSTLPTPFTPTAQKIHRLYETAQILFYRQQQPSQQYQQHQDEPSMSPHPQQLIMRQQQQMQQPDFNKMMMLQQQQQVLLLQQQLQQGNFMVNSLSGDGGGGGNSSSISSNNSINNNYMYPSTQIMTPPRY